MTTPFNIITDTNINIDHKMSWCLTEIQSLKRHFKTEVIVALTFRLCEQLRDALFNDASRDCVVRCEQ